MAAPLILALYAFCFNQTITMMRNHYVSHGKIRYRQGLSTVCVLVYLLCFVGNVNARLGLDCDSSGSCDQRVKTLYSILEAFENPENLTKSWKGQNPCENWYGIDCQEGVIKSVTLISMKLNCTISPSFADIPSLEVIDLSDNQLTGVIPFELLKLNLETLDVSFNDLHGIVPQFRTTDPDTQGNLKMETRILQVPSESSNTKKSLLVRLIVAICVLVCLMVIARVYSALRFFLKRKRSDSLPEDDESSIPMQILRVATDDFGSHNFIGRGGFGSIYKGKLQDGTEIAVKKMDQSRIGGQGVAQFKAEVRVLTKVHHRNLVILHGFCVEENDRFLVYEYMRQGSLSRQLFDWEKERLEPLQWHSRLTAALDVARGVEYLHTLALEHQSYIHRDPKPENILLGDDMRAKVSDFGLVRCTEEGGDSTETRAVGTYGYIAPEYTLRGLVTSKIDVYSFGVVLMELLTAEKAIDKKRHGDDALIATWFKKMFAEKDEFAKIIDNSINVCDEIQGSINEVAQLACHCCATNP